MAVYTGYRYRAGALNELASTPASQMVQGGFSATIPTARATGQREIRSLATHSAGRFSDVPRKMPALVPSPSNRGQLNNYQVIGAQQFDRNVYTTRIDHNFSEQNRLNMLLYWNRQLRTSVGAGKNPGRCDLDVQFRNSKERTSGRPSRHM